MWDGYVEQALAQLGLLQLLRSLRLITPSLEKLNPVDDEAPIEAKEDGEFKVFDEMQLWDRASVEVEIAESTVQKRLLDIPSSDVEAAGDDSHLAEFSLSTKPKDPRNKFQKLFQEKMGTPTNGSGNGGKTRWMMGLHLKGRKESDNEDLHLFRELHKHGKERTACFLLPVHDLEHSNGGNSSFYRIQSIRKESEFELLSEGNKNDYDWLKTPPATPLFPSLEMEATAPHMKAQKETRFLQLLSQPQSQASNNSESTKRSNGIEKSPTTNPRIPSRSITPSYRPRINSSTEPKNTQRITNPNQRISQASSTDPTIKRNNNKTKSTNLKESYTDYLTSNLSKPKAKSNPNPNPRSRTTSPIVRSTIASQIPEFSNETPPNLRTDRSSSVTRGRQVGTEQKPEAININSRRQSCSPSVTRGRKVEAKQEINRGGNLSNDQRRTESTNIIGSRMVERVMNARKGNKNASKLCV